MIDSVDAEGCLVLAFFYLSVETNKSSAPSTAETKKTIKFNLKKSYTKYKVVDGIRKWECQRNLQ